MAFFQWRQWLKRFRQSVYGKARKKARRPAPLDIETLEDRIVPSGWTQITNQPPNFIGTMDLLPNGSVLCSVNGCSNEFYELTPNASGSYDDGTWTQVASSSLQRLYYGEVVLPNDEVMIYGGEYSGSAGQNNIVNSGEIYNIASNTWSPVQTINSTLNPNNAFGDDPLELLPNGEVLGGNLFDQTTWLYNVTTNTWSFGPTKINGGSGVAVSGQNERTDEESWVKLPGTGGNILDYELFASMDVSPGSGEYLNVSGNAWEGTGSVPVPLSEDNVYELGPALTLPNGDVLQVGANGSFGSTNTNTALYNPTTNLWTAGPVIPDTMTADDAAGCVLPDGNVLFTADSGAPASSPFNPPAEIYEYNYTTNTISVAPGIPAALASQLASEPSYETRFLDLPNGQVLYTDEYNTLWTYSENAPNAAWAPTISNITANGAAFTLSGTQLNGLDEGGEYGDDNGMASNYPLVQLTNGSGTVSYAETSNWSLPGAIATGATPVSTTFAAPASPGPYLLDVTANGIPSSDVLFIDMGGNNYTLRIDPSHPADAQVLLNGVTSEGDFPVADFTAIYAIGNGDLTVDYSNGAFGMPVNYAGGAAASSTITMADTAAPATLVYNATGASAGNFIVNGNAVNEVEFTTVGAAVDTANATTLTINADPNNAVAGALSDSFSASGPDTLATLGGSLPSLNFVSPSGTLVVNGHTAGANDITFATVGSGFNSALTVNGNSGNDTVALDASLTLGSATATGDVSVTAATIDLDAAVDAGGGPTPGSITLTGNVDLTGSSSLWFGGIDGLLIADGNVNLGANNLDLIDFATTDTADIGVLISGSGGSLTKSGPGTVTLGDADSYTGATTISAGTLADGVTNGLPTATQLSDSGTLNLDGFSQQVSTVTGSGLVTDSSSGAVFTVDPSGVDSFAGTFGGTLALTMGGVGILDLTGASNNSGAGSVNSGTLQVDGQLSSQVTVNNTGTLDGTGQVGPVTVNSGGTVSPGDSATGQLTVNGVLTMTSGAIYADEIASTGYGQLIVSGPTIGLNNATLALSVATGFILPFESAYEIINNTGAAAIGTIFNGLAEGATVTASNGRQFTITYLGGTGNDVVVTEKAMNLIWDGDASAGTDPDWTNPDNWVGDVAPATGDTLVFGAVGALQIATNDNNYTTGTTFGSIEFLSAGYTLGGGGGNGFNLTDGISSQPSGANTIDLPITLSGAQAFQTSLTTSTLDLDGAIQLDGNTLTTSGPGVIDADANIVGATAASAIDAAGTGTFIIGAASASTYAGPTSVSGGVLEVDGSIASNVTVTGGTLTGVGSTGTVTAKTAGNLFLGATISTLTSGALSLQASAAFNELIASESSCSSITTSSVTIGSSVTLNLFAGSFTPAGGETYILINNTGNSAVSGEFVAGTGVANPGNILGEGAIISTDFLGSGHVATLTYKAGPHGNSVAILVSTTLPLSYTGPDHFLLDQQFDPSFDAAAGNVLAIYNINNPASPVLLAYQATSQTSLVEISGGSGDATLTIDYTSPFTTPVTFDGGTGSGSTFAHTLTLQNGAYTTATFNDATASSGTIALDSEMVAYTDLTAGANPALIDTTTEANLIFNLPAGAQGTLEDDGVAGNGVSAFVTSNGTFADATYEDPTNTTGTLTVNANGGSSEIQLGAMDSLFSPATETLTGLAGDTFQFVSASAVPTTTTLALTTATLDLNGLSPTINALTGNGTITNKSTTTAAVLSVGAGGGSGAFSGIIEDGSETTGLTKLGAGTETLSGTANSYSGPTTITAGTLQAGAADALSANSDVADNATLDVKGASQIIGALSGAGIVTSSTAGTPTLTVGADNDGATFSGTIKNGSAASVALTKSGTGAEVFNSTTNTYTGGTTISAGILQIGDGTSFGNVGPTTAAVNVGVNGTLQFDSPGNSTSNTKTFANNISGAGIISAISANSSTGLGAVLITGTNTNFTGALHISGGSYELGSAGALGGAAAINVSGTGQFYFGTVTSLTVNATVAISTTGYLDSAGTVGPLGAIRFAGASDVLAGAVTVTNTALVSAYVSSGAGSGTIKGNISGAGTLDIGSGLSSETIVLTGNDGAATTQVNASAALQVGNSGTTGALTGTTVADDGSLVFKRTDKVTVGVSITGSGGALTQAGTGTLVLPSTNTYSYTGATTAATGILEVDGALTSNITATGGTLTGVGSTTGSVTGNSASTIYQSTAVSSLAGGALTLNAGTDFNVGISAVNTSSQITASGAISVSGAVLNIATINYTPTPGDVYTIIVNNSGAAVSGLLVAGTTIDNFAAGTPLQSGADLSDNFMNTGRTATLYYNYGPNSDSVAIVVSLGGQLTYNSAGTGNHNFILRENNNLPTPVFDLFDTTVSLTVPVATQAIALTTAININLSPVAPNDAALTIDYGGGYFTNKVSFSGSTGTGTLPRTLTIENSTGTTAITSESFTYTGAEAGAAQLDVQPIIYADVTSVADASSITAANVAFTFPASTQATFGTLSGVSDVSSPSSGFPTTSFADPSSAFSVQTAGSSVVQLGAMDSSFSPLSEAFTGLASDKYKLTSAAALPSTAGVTLTTATLDLHGVSPTFDALNGSGPITNSGAAATLTIGANGGLGTFNGVIQNGTGAIALTKHGAGVETLGGASTYTGATTISAGKIVDAIANALPTGTALSVGGTLDLAGFNQTVAGVTGTGAVTDSVGGAIFTVNDGAADTFAGTIIGGLALAKTGVGKLTLTQANSYAGSTSVGAGTLAQGFAGAVPSNPITVNGTLDLSGFSLQVPSLTGTGTVTNSNTTTLATFTLNDASADAFAGTFTGNLALSNAGAGTLTLTKASTYTGATAVNNGTIADGIANALPIGTALSVTGTLDLAGFAQQVASVFGSGTVTDSSATFATFSVNLAAGTDGFSGTLGTASNALAVAKLGAGTLILNGSDSYTGATTISAGILQLGNASAIPATSDVADNATLDLHGYSATIGALSGSSTTAVVVSNAVSGAVVFTIGATGDSGMFAGAIKASTVSGAGPLAVTKTGAGTETCTAAQTYTGPTTLAGGALIVNGSLYTAAAPGVVNLATAGVALGGSGTIHGVVSLQASGFGAETSINGLTIAMPAVPSSVGITVAAAAAFAQIGVTKGVTVNGGTSTSTGILVNGSAMIFNSNISGHLIDVDVSGGNAVLQKDTLNAGTTAAIGWTGLEAQNNAIVDAGQLSSDAAPLPTPYAVGNVGLYGDITGLFSGTQLGSSQHSIGGNTFNGYTASTATSNPTTVAQAIRDLNTGAVPANAANFQTVLNGVETSFSYGANFHLGRMDLTARQNTFNGVANPTNAVIKSFVFDGQRSANPGTSTIGWVVYGLPPLTVTQSGVPASVAPGGTYTITIGYANTGVLPTFGVLTEDVPTSETVNLAVDPGWVSQGNGVYTYSLGLLGAGASGNVRFVVSVIAKPTTGTLTTEATIEPDLISDIVIAINYISTNTTVSPNNLRWH